MSRRSGTGIRALKKPVVVLAGEDRNDRHSLRVLLEDLCPDTRGRIVEITDSVRLRGATGSNLSGRVSTLAQKANARARREGADIACVFVHEDLDVVDDDHYDVMRDRVQKALDVTFASAHYVLAVAEIEAWLLLFPDAITANVSSWKVPRKYRNSDTGLINGPKEVLIRECCPANRRYQERDAPEVFAKAVELGCLDQPRGTNRSWNQLRADIDECGLRHIPRMRSRGE